MNEAVKAVFVYGTLKQGERNFHVALGAGWLRSEQAWLEGFQLFHIPQRERLPYPYPAMATGAGRVWGEVQWFADLDAALKALDVLEDEGNEYLRIQAEAHLGGALEPHGFENRQRVKVWTYVYPHQEAVIAARGIHLPEGIWPASNVEGSLVDPQDW